jgi:voltage-gated potassium channel
MKFAGLLLSWLSAPLRQRQTRPFFTLAAAMVVLVTVYSVGFHFLMAAEGQSYAWSTGIYWTIVTMSTLGYGDVVFTSAAGQLFSVVVLLSGSALILVLLPFTFIQFVFMPWMDARERRRAPRELPADTAGHLVLTALGPMEASLIEEARRSAVPYVIIEPDLPTALRLHGQGHAVMVGELDDPTTYANVRFAHASGLVASRTDATNSNIVFTARELGDAPIVCTAESPAAVDILELAGASRVLQMGRMLGEALAHRILRPTGASHVIGHFGDLLIAEATADRQTLAGHTLREAQVRHHTGVTVVGLWTRGEFSVSRPDTPIDAGGTLVLAGTRSQLDAFDARYGTESVHGLVVILGGGRVGRRLAEVLDEAGIDWRVVERDPAEFAGHPRWVTGDAAELSVLTDAGLPEASTVVVTTHDDDTNLYLALYCRRLRPDVEMLARANQDRNVATLYRAGADIVVSQASLGASAAWDLIGGEGTLLLTEGLGLFRVPIPARLAGRTLADAGIRERTGCSVVAVRHHDQLTASPGPEVRLPAKAELVLIGDLADQQRFHDAFGENRHPIGSS